MKNLLHVCLATLLLLVVAHGQSKNIYKYQIEQTEVDELNKLGDALGISGTGWPVSGEEFESTLNVKGIGFVQTNKVFLRLQQSATNPEEKDSVFVLKHKVKSVFFSYAGLSGSIPDVSFPELEKFYMANSNLSGEIPSLDLPKCTELNLRYNKLSGKVPSFSLPNLVKLELGNNELSGEIPDFNLPSLEILNLNNNKFSGILRLFTGLPALKELNVRTNKLTGIEKSFGSATLEKFEAGSNEYTGQLPSFNCPKLQRIYLSYHEFSGEIPNDMVLTSCTSFEITNNNLSGSLPELNLPSVNYFNVSRNKLSGAVPSFSGMPAALQIDIGFNEFVSLPASFSHATLTSFVAWENKLEGNIPAFNLPNGEYLNLSGNNLSGTIPNLNCPKLISLGLEVNNLTGEIPNFNMPFMRTLRLHENNLTGPIPNFNMPELFYLDLSSNELSGEIPDFDFPQLNELEIGGNNLTGSLPNFNMPDLTELDVSSNNLTGEIPDLNLPSLLYLELGFNNFSGELPAFSFPECTHLNIPDNNLSGKIPDMYLPKAEFINLYDNNFEGAVPAFNCPNLRGLNLKNNKLTGQINTSGMPALMVLNVNENEITGLPHLKSSSPNLYGALVASNRLTFEDIEPNIDILNFQYENQDSVEHYITQVGGQTFYSVRVGGSANHYQWRKNVNKSGWVDIPNANKDSVEIQVQENADYTCKITNTIAPGLILYSLPSKGPSCISVGIFELCVEDGAWEKDKENKLATSGKITINELLFFEGKMTIDTVDLTVKAEGEFYMNEIPLPGGSSGKYQFCKGEYELKLAGEDGAITNFLDSKFDQLGQLFGIDLKLAKLQLVGGRNPIGVKLDCKIGVPGISGSCGEGGDTKTEFELSGLEFSTAGIKLEGVVVNDLGLLLDGYCLKNLTLKYDSEKDVLTSGAHVELPFGEIGGGFSLSKGYLDSIAWHLEAAKPPFVLGTTTIGIKGFFGHISNITKPPIEVELGGIFSDITTDKLYKINASGRTVWPSVFAVKGEGTLLKPPLIDKPYQMQGGIEMEYDIPMNLFKMSFEGKVGTSDAETWLIDGKGNLKLSHKFSPAKISGELEGKMSLPKFADKFPYNWLNSMFSFPVEAASQSTFIWGRSRLLHGTASFETETQGPYGLRYVLNLEKSYDDPDFIWFETTAETKSAKLKSGSIANETKEFIDVPEGTEFFIVGVLGETSAPASVLRSPGGKTYNATSESDKVLLTKTADEKQAFWTINAPEKGNWEITLNNPAEKDSILLFVQEPSKELSILSTQTGNLVTVTWDPSLFTSGQNIVLMLDEDNKGFDGAMAAEGEASAGSITFELSDSLSLCSYHLFAQVYDETSVLQDYAEDKVFVEKGILAAPEVLDIDYNRITKTAAIRFRENTDVSISGYIVTIFDESGADSTYTIVNYGQSEFNVEVDGIVGKWVTMTSFSKNGMRGCPSEAFSLTTSIQDERFEVNNREELKFYPNPTSGKGTIQFSLNEDSWCKLVVSDFSGRVIAVPVDEKRSHGNYEESWDFKDLPNGMYLISLVTKQGIQTSKCILQR